jgi:hypothetical protein
MQGSEPGSEPGSELGSEQGTPGRLVFVDHVPDLDMSEAAGLLGLLTPVSRPAAWARCNTGRPTASPTRR